MGYASSTELRGRLKGAFDQLYPASAADLAAASAEIDAALAGRYQVPVTAAEAQELLKSYALALAEELAWSRADCDRIPEAVAARAARVRAALDKFAGGSYLLAGAAEAAGGVGGAVVVAGDEPVFTREKMSGY